MWTIRDGTKQELPSADYIFYAVSLLLMFSVSICTAEEQGSRVRNTHSNIQIQYIQYITATVDLIRTVHKNKRNKEIAQDQLVHTRQLLFRSIPDRPYTYLDF